MAIIEQRVPGEVVHEMNNSGVRPCAGVATKAVKTRESAKQTLRDAKREAMSYMTWEGGTFTGEIHLGMVMVLPSGQRRRSQSCSDHVDCLDGDFRRNRHSIYQDPSSLSVCKHSDLDSRSVLPIVFQFHFLLSRASRREMVRNSFIEQ